MVHVQQVQVREKGWSAKIVSCYKQTRHQLHGDVASEGRARVQVAVE